MLRWSRPGIFWRLPPPSWLPRVCPRRRWTPSCCLRTSPVGRAPCCGWPGAPSPTSSPRAYAALVAQRVQRIPLQHLTGPRPIPPPRVARRARRVHPAPGDRADGRPCAGVRGRRIAPGPESVGGRAADPRISTGESGQPRARLLVVDLCSGSAALALSIATEVPGSRVIAVELSTHGRGLGTRNIADHAAQVAAMGSSIELSGRDATAVAANGGPSSTCADPSTSSSPTHPTCPRTRSHGSRRCATTIPDLALYGGHDGLEVVRPLAEQAALLLRPGGLLLIEHADVQGESAGESGVPGVLRAQREPADREPGAGVGTRPRVAGSRRPPRPRRSAPAHLGDPRAGRMAP